MREDAIPVESDQPTRTPETEGGDFSFHWNRLHALMKVPFWEIDSEEFQTSFEVMVQQMDRFENEVFMAMEDACDAAIAELEQKRLRRT